MSPDRSITGWFEDVTEGLRAAGHTVCTTAFRDPKYPRFVDNLLISPILQQPRCRYIVNSIMRFRPDLIIAVDGFAVPEPILQHLTSMPNRPPLIAWVGDRFDDNYRISANYYDLVAYTDTGFFRLHEQLLIKPDAIYLPHAINPHSPSPLNAPRQQSLVFIAVATPFRRSLVNALEHPITIYGPGWTSESDTPHNILARRVPRTDLPIIYAEHSCTINIRSETHIINGLNQRSFSPYLQATAVLSDFQPDIELCFSPGEDVLVYHDADDLVEMQNRLLREPHIATEIGQKGQRRVLKEHTFSKRLETIQFYIGTRARNNFFI